MQRYYYVLLCLILFQLPLIAQQNTTASTTTGFENVPTYDWLFFSETDDKLLYVDLEAFNGVLTDIRLKNESEEVVYSEEMLDTPVNTIFEIDLKNYQKGEYELELRTYKEVLCKKIVVE